MELKIEKMTAGDKSDVMEMMRDFYSSEAVYTNGSDEIFGNDIDACVSGCPFAEGYVFRDNKTILGYAMLAKSFSTEFGKMCVWIEDLYIKDKYRGKGIGGEFFKMIFSTYKDVLFRLEVEKGNNAAVSLYKKCGFGELPYTEMFKI